MVGLPQPMRQSCADASVLMPVASMHPHLSNLVVLYAPAGIMLQLVICTPKGIACKQPAGRQAAGGGCCSSVASTRDCTITGPLC
jgi:hypothetical protein